MKNILNILLVVLFWFTTYMVSEGCGHKRGKIVGESNWVMTLPKQGAPDSGYYLTTDGCGCGGWGLFPQMFPYYYKMEIVNCNGWEYVYSCRQVSGKDTIFKFISPLTSKTIPKCDSVICGYCLIDTLFDGTKIRNTHTGTSSTNLPIKDTNTGTTGLTFPGGPITEGTLTYIPPKDTTQKHWYQTIKQ